MSSMIRRSEHQAGIISIMVTMIMMVVISLIVLGFAEISRTEQRNATDNQLSAQAFYAAESGVNDARVAIDNYLANGQAVPSKPDCSNDANYTLSGTVNAGFNVSYTCVTIDPAVSSLAYKAGYTSIVIPINTGNQAIGKLNLSWNIAVGLLATTAGCFNNSGQLGDWPVASPGAGNWNCNYPVLRIDMLDANGTLSRASWGTNTATMFFVPFVGSSGGSSNVSFSASGQAVHGQAVPAQCSAANCTASITGLGGSSYYMRVTTLYRTNSLLTISTNSGKSFYGTQVTIDSTGKAQDVLRRVVVALDLTDANSHAIPSAALVLKDSLCKRYGVTNGSFDVYDDLSAGGGGNPQCRQQSGGSPIP